MLAAARTIRLGPNPTEFSVKGGEIKKLLGQDVRALRKADGVTLQALASAIGRSIGWLSQLERGQTSPSVQDLDRIADFFGVDVSFFFRSSSPRPEERGLVRRRADRVPIGAIAPGLKEELLSPVLSGAFEMLWSVFEPNCVIQGQMPARQTEEGGVLISGQLTLTIGDVILDLEPGDSFQFSDREYSWKNEGDESAVVIWVISPPIIRRMNSDQRRELQAGHQP